MSRHETLAHVDINVRPRPTTRCHLAPMLTNTTLIRNSLDTERVTIVTTDQCLITGPMCQVAGVTRGKFQDTRHC